MNIQRVAVAVTVAGLTAVATVDAATMTASSMAPATGTFFDSSTSDTASGVKDWRYRNGSSSNSARDVGQLWTAGSSYDLGAITVRVGSNDSTPAGSGYTLVLYSVDLSGGLGAPTYTQLGTHSGTTPTINSGDYLTVALDGKTAITAGSTYAFLFQWNSQFSNNTQKVSLRHSGGTDGLENSYIIQREFNGSTATRPSTSPSWTGDGGTIADGSDLVFFTSEAVPEPASIGLLSLGGLIALRRRRAAV